MAYFKNGIVLEPGDLEHETPWFVNHYWEWLLGESLIEPTKIARDINLLK